MRVSPQKLSALVQVEKEVTRGGRTHTQHYWVRGGGEEIRAVPMLARGEAEKPPTISLPTTRHLVSESKRSGTSPEEHTEANPDARAGAHAVSEATREMSRTFNEQLGSGARPAQGAIARILPFGIGGQFVRADRQIHLAEGTAQSVSRAIYDGEIRSDDEREAFSVLTHEMIHASNPAEGPIDRSEVWEREATSRPGGVLEEATTEILAQHYLPQVLDSLGVEDKDPTRTLIAEAPIFKGSTTYSASLGRITSYAGPVTSFGTLTACLLDKLPFDDKGNMDAEEVSNSAVSWAAKLRPLTTEERYNTMADRVIQNFHPDQVGVPDYDDLRASVSWEISRFMILGGLPATDLMKTVRNSVRDPSAREYDPHSSWAQVKQSREFGASMTRARATKEAMLGRGRFPEPEKPAWMTQEDWAQERKEKRHERERV